MDVGYTSEETGTQLTGAEIPVEELEKLLLARALTIRRTYPAPTPR